ncbi:iron chelate uptake ABC transporter family permease subunit [Leucobacter sp. UCMA 4100]|uniref:FecCD family ABC transporter permease n=1 Tax=Leucobacter sp. UCMA 4100 TaxID=2810534 RepID=UPI0022EA5B00|nr:iron chelate uptake ABC transporter family permease subunit [Leucobacter sp. UCMA 4100]MDA3146443.1 iron chelate uptake ABC transporter family permease subunit [Leucobacter sp. UCMA 4100]
MTSLRANSTSLDDPPGAPPGTAAVRGLARRRTVGMLVIVGALVLAATASLAFGAKILSVEETWAAFWHPDGSEAATIVWTLRAPRTLAGIVVGAAFGVAGALIQALTRNPIADPGILGVNAGAGFAVTIGIGITGVTNASEYVWYAFIGAALATLLVTLIGSAGRGPASPVTLVLAGVALGAVLNGFSTFLSLIDPDTFRAVRNWGLGSIERTDLGDTLSVLPLIVVGLVIALLVSGPLNSIALGDELAATLGARVARTRVLVIIAVTLLAGGGTALTGGIGFVGLMVPHIMRWIFGPDQRWILATSALAAPVLVLAADVLGRVIARPGEIEVGVLTAIIGAPVLIALVRGRKSSGL